MPKRKRTNRRKAAAGTATREPPTKKTPAKQPARRRPSAVPSPTNGRDPFVMATLSDVAAFFGVALATVKGWRSDSAGAMPGTPGAYNVRDVARWKMSRINDRSPAGEQLAKLDVAKRAQELKIGQVKLKKLLAEVIDVEVVGHLIGRIIVEHNAIADELGERIRQMIPAAGARIGPNDAEDIADNVDQLVDEMRRAMASGLDEWAQQLKGGTNGEAENENENDR